VALNGIILAFSDYRLTGTKVSIVGRCSHSDVFTTNVDYIILHRGTLDCSLRSREKQIL